MFCSECGQPNAEGARFCTACGNALMPRGDVAGVAPRVPSPYAPVQTAPLPQPPVISPTSPQAADGEPTQALPPLRVGTDGPDGQGTPSADMPPQYSIPSAPASQAAPPEATIQTSETSQLYGVAPGAVNPFHVSPTEIPPYTPGPEAPVSGVPPFASATQTAPASPAGYGVAQPIYGAQCRVCGNALAAGMTQCGRCGTPVGMIVNANDPTANSYVSVGVPNVPYSAGMAQAVPNSSGQAGAPPAELPAGWNWGAAFATYFWAAAHQVWWYVAMQSVLILVILTLWIGAVAANNNALGTIVGLLFILYCAIWTICRVAFGIHGNRMAWRRRRFDSLYQFVDVQEAWKPIGIVMGLIALLCALLFGGLVLLGLLGASMMRS